MDIVDMDIVDIDIFDIDIADIDIVDIDIVDIDNCQDISRPTLKVYLPFVFLAQNINVGYEEDCKEGLDEAD